MLDGTKSTSSRRWYRKERPIGDLIGEAMASSTLDRKFIRHNIYALYKSSGLGLTDFAKSIGMTRTGIDGILSGINTCSLASLVKIANKKSVSLDWLCTDNGDRGEDADTAL
jgi:DNA-binding phage protein